MSWKVKSKKEVYRNKWMYITEDVVVTDYGDKSVFGIVHKEPAVLIIPWDGQKFLLVGQYRYSVDYFSWEFPQGHFEHKNIKEAAIHELEEEAEVKAEQLKEIGHFFLAPGHHTQKYYVFLATGLSKGKAQRDEDEEGMKTRKVTSGQMEKMIKNEEIMDGPTISGFQIFKLYSQKHFTKT